MNLWAINVIVIIDFKETKKAYKIKRTKADLWKGNQKGPKENKRRKDNHGLM